MVYLNLTLVEKQQAYKILVNLYEKRKKNVTTFKMVQILTITIFYSNILLAIIAPFTAEMPSELMFYPAKRAIVYIACTILLSICVLLKQTNADMVFAEPKLTWANIFCAEIVNLIGSIIIYTIHDPIKFRTLFPLFLLGVLSGFLYHIAHMRFSYNSTDINDRINHMMDDLTTVIVDKKLYNCGRFDKSNPVLKTLIKDLLYDHWRKEGLL